jgi:hypothetical protein
VPDIFFIRQPGGGEKFLRIKHEVFGCWKARNALASRASNGRCDFQAAFQKKTAIREPGWLLQKISIR